MTTPATTLSGWKRALEIAVLVAAALVTSAAAVDAASAAQVATKDVRSVRV